MKNFKIKFHFISAAICFGGIFATYASEIENAKQLGQLHGKILTLPGNDLSSVIIQVVGATDRDPFVFYTRPDENGEFNFDGLLPAGSVVQLYLWDGKGALNRTIMNAYVSSMHSNAAGTYEITMQDAQYTQDLSDIHKMTHEVANTGLCGFVSEDGHGNPSAVRLAVFDRSAKYAGPLGFQNIDENGKFCFFNLASPSRTDLYDFVLFDAHGEQTTFTFYLPPWTFLHDVYFDVKSALYRAPVTNPSNAVHFSTSDDYAPVLADGSLAYFSLANELLEISYNVGGATQDRFFILFPRTQLFQNGKIHLASRSGSEMIYVDDMHSLSLNFVTEDELINLNSNLYFQTWNESFGSVFLNLDLSQFGIENSNDVRVSLRNAAGQEVSAFEGLVVKNFAGYFLNIFPGTYHLFLTTTDGQLLWTYEVRSYPNRVQMLVNDVNPLKPSPRAVATTSWAASSGLNDAYPEIFGMYQFANIESSVELNAMHHEARFVANNILHQYDADVFCRKVQPRKFLDTLADLN